MFTDIPDEYEKNDPRFFTAEELDQIEAGDYSGREYIPNGSLIPFPEVVKNIESRIPLEERVSLLYILELSLRKPYFLDLSGFSLNLNKDDIENCIIPFLEKNPHIKKFRSCNFLTADSVEALCRIENITDIDLSATEAESVIVLAASKQLTTLRLKDTNIGDQGAVELSKSTSILRLEVSSCQIGDVGAKALASNKVLQELAIAQNLLSDEGLSSLLESNSLKKLSAHHNRATTTKGWKTIILNDSLDYLYAGSLQGIKVADTMENEVKKLRITRNNERKLAFLMGSHSRVGENSPILWLYRSGGRDVIEEIFKYVIPSQIKFK